MAKRSGNGKKKGEGGAKAMSLVHDAVEAIPVGPNKRASFRIRHWAGTGAFPLILIGAAGGPAPEAHTDAVATWVYTRRLLARDGFFYVEDNGRPKVDLVNFRCVNLRLMFAENKQAVGRDVVDRTVGLSIDY